MAQAESEKAAAAKAEGEKAPAPKVADEAAAKGSLPINFFRAPHAQEMSARTTRGQLKSPPDQVAPLSWKATWRT